MEATEKKEKQQRERKQLQQRDNNDSNTSLSRMICEESKDLVDDDGNNRHSRWTPQERNTVIHCLALYGKDYTRISTIVPRTAKIIGNHVSAHSLYSLSNKFKLREEE